MASRVLIINRQLAFSVALKQALERTGTFDVHPFTTLDAAIEYLQQNTQDVALVDLSSVSINITELINRLRRVQPDLSIIVSPEQPAVSAQALRLQASIDPPFSARDIMPLLTNAVKARMRGDLAERPASEPDVPGSYTTDLGAMANTDVFKQDVQPGSSRPVTNEIDDDQLRPYMYSTDLFKQRSTESLGPKPVDTNTQDLPPPSTDIFRDPAPSPSKPDFPESLSEQDLLNLALQRGMISNPESAGTQIFSDEQNPAYQISTDIFKGQDDEPFTLSAADAGAMWEQLTKELPSSAPPPAPEEPYAFEFEDDQRTPIPTPSEAPISITDRLIARAQDADFPVDAFEPVENDIIPHMTDLLIQAAQDVEVSLDDPDMLPPSSTEALVQRAQEIEPVIDSSILHGGEWGFPDEPANPFDQYRRTTEGLPVENTDESAYADFAEVEALSRTTGKLDGSSLPAALEDKQPVNVNPADRNANWFLEASEDFEPPISPEDLITTVLQQKLPSTAELTPPPQVELPPPLYADDNTSMRRLESRAQEERLVEQQPQGKPEQSSIERLEAIAAELKRTQATEKFAQPPSPAPDDISSRLAAEEPPFPDTLDEGGTVGDLYVGVQDPTFQNVLQILRGDEQENFAAANPAPTSNADRPRITQSEIDELFSAYGVSDPNSDLPDMFDDEESTPAQVILETAFDESTPADDFSLPALINSIERQLNQQKPLVRSLPSWSRDNSLNDDLYVREPEFLQDVIDEVDALPRLDEQEQSDPFGEATTFGGSPVITVQDMETEWLPSKAPEPRVTDEWALEPPVAEDDTDGVTRPLVSASQPPVEPLPQLEDQEPEFNTEFERLAAFSPEDEAEDTPPLGVSAIQDPYIAQIALSLTQISLEEVAGAVLTRDEEVVAFAGRMGRTDIDEVGAAINHQWDNPSDEAIIRFVTLSSSGRDVMLYSRHTVNDLTLSLIFPGAVSMRDIRKQGKRLAEALMAVPDPIGSSTAAKREDDALGSPSSDVRGVYTYVWLLRNPEQRLSDMVARAIESGMHIQLAERAWQVRNLLVQDEFVYLIAEVPGETPPYEVVRDLKRRAADIARKQNPSLGKGDLWADGYLIVSPGRELDQEEIRQFIEFERMA